MRGTNVQKRSGWLIAIAVVLVLLTGQVLWAGGQSGESEGREVITLRFTAGHPYAAASWVKAIEDFYIPEITRRVLEETSDYELKCTGFYGGSLAKLGEVLEAVESGTADVGLTNNVFEQAKLEIFNFNWWPPFTSPNLPDVVKANEVIMDKFPIFDEVFARYNQRQLGRAFNMATSFELVTNFPIKTLEDLQGRKIAHGGSMIPWLQALGAVGVQSTFSDAYTSIDTGVYEGWAIPADVATTFKVYEVAPYVTKVGFGSFVNGYLTINLDTWNSLPPEVQKIMDEVGYEYTQDLYRRETEDLDKAYDIMRDAGCTITEISPQERQRWAKILYDAKVGEAAAKKADANGYPGSEILAAYLEALEEAGYEFPYRSR
jgi:TRAP-type C4-dicarboxylate transport system substrate-binding protein